MKTTYILTNSHDGPQPLSFDQIENKPGIYRIIGPNGKMEKNRLIIVSIYPSEPPLYLSEESGKLFAATGDWSSFKFLESSEYLTVCFDNIKE